MWTCGVRDPFAGRRDGSALCFCSPGETRNAAGMALPGWLCPGWQSIAVTRNRATRETEDILAGYFVQLRSRSSRFAFSGSVSRLKSLQDRVAAIFLFFGPWLKCLMARVPGLHDFPRFWEFFLQISNILSLWFLSEPLHVHVFRAWPINGHVVDASQLSCGCAPLLFVFECCRFVPPRSDV